MLNSNILLQHEDIFRHNSSSRIIPYINRNRSSTLLRNRSTGIIESKIYNTKESIEAIIYEILINEKVLANEKTDPFGAIYLCDLQPDTIDYSYIEKIRYFSKIRDVSDSIHFNDGMDD